MTDLDLDYEQGAEEHHVPADLLELYEVLELEGKIVAPAMARQGPGYFVPRAVWGARRPTGSTALHNPPGIALHYEGPPMGTFPHSSCAVKVRGIQNFHMNVRGWTDGAYNLIVCPHGYVFELRGRDVRSAANGTNYGNGRAHALCALIGQGDPVTSELLKGIIYGRQWLMEGGTGSETYGHRDFKATACPGDPLYGWHKGGWPSPGGGEVVTGPPPNDQRCPDEPGRVGHPTISRGARGVPVLHLQWFLNISGAKIAGDGDFGPATDRAVRNHQTWLRDFRDGRIKVDGIVGPITWQAMHNWLDGKRI